MTRVVVGPTTHRRGVAAAAALVGGSAIYGAVGLIFSFLGFPAELEQRLPLQSPVVGGLALVLIVAFPFIELSMLAWRGDRRTNSLCFVSGVTLIVWIAIELAFIRELSFLQPVCVAIGFAFAWVGRETSTATSRRADSSRYPIGDGTQILVDRHAGPDFVRH